MDIWLEQKLFYMNDTQSKSSMCALPLKQGFLSYSFQQAKI